MAAESCDYRLAANLTADCTAPTVKGLKNKGVIVNYDDIDFDACTRDTGNPNIYTALVLKSGKKGYEVSVPGKTPFTGTKISLNAGTYRNTFTKDVALVLFNSGPDVSRDIVDQLANGTFVVVLENKFAGADGKNTFEIFGIETGLSATAIDNDKYSDDTDGGWLINLQETGAPSSAIFLYNKSITATRTALASLTSPEEEEEA